MLKKLKNDDGSHFLSVGDGVVALISNHGVSVSPDDNWFLDPTRKLEIVSKFYNCDSIKF